MVADDLRRLATAHGVATAYRNERRELVQVDTDVVVRVLRLLEVEAGNEADRRRELARLNEQPACGCGATHGRRPGDRTAPVVPGGRRGAERGRRAHGGAR